MDKIITAFFYEGINRIIPGLVFIGFYYNQEVEKAFHRFQNQDLFVVICVLIAAWLIGIILDAITWCPFKLFMDYLGGKKLLGEAKCEKEADGELEHLRLKCIKQQAEKIMFRVLFQISILTWFVPPNGLFEQEWHRSYSWYGILTFGSLFIFRCISDRKN